MFTFITAIQHNAESYSWLNKVREVKKKGIQIGREEIKQSLFAAHITISRNKVTFLFTNHKHVTFIPRKDEILKYILVKAKPEFVC